MNQEKPLSVVPLKNRGDTDPPEDAVARLLRFMGDDPARPGLHDTPRRVCEALRELTKGYDTDPVASLGTVFTNDEAYRGPVIVAGIQFTSLCEHHMLPFTGRATLMYEPADALVGLSKLPRMFLAYAQRLQVQERLTQQALDAMIQALTPRSAGVVVTAVHSCMTIRGIRSTGVTTTTATHGQVDVDSLIDRHHTSQTLADVL